jgi:hypothetical protein
VLTDVAICCRETLIGRRQRLQVIKPTQEGDLGHPAPPGSTLGPQVVEDVAPRHLADPPRPVRALVKQIVIDLGHVASVAVIAAKRP